MSSIRRWPLILLQRMLHQVDARLNRCHWLAGPWQAFKWRVKYRLDSPRYTPAFETLLHQPHRRWLVEAVLSFGGRLGGVLEVGCGKGQNLVLLRRALDDVRLEGIDISSSAVDAGRKELAARNLSKIRLRLGGTEDLSDFGEGEFDVVIADAVMMYVPPERITPALKNMLRIATRGVVMGTWHQDSPADGKPIYDEGTWIYDYRQLLQHINGLTINIHPYPAGAWQDQRWRRYGAILTLTHVAQDATSGCIPLSDISH